MAGQFSNRHHWIFCAAVLAVWLALGWPFLHELATGAVRRAVPVPAFWLVPYVLFGSAMLGAILLELGTRLRWALVCVQLAAVAVMAVTFPKDLMTLFLIVIAWQTAMTVSGLKALGWVAFQTLAIIGVLYQAPGVSFSYIVALSVVLQLCSVLTAQALRREGKAARDLARRNRQLRAAQAVIAGNVRDAERMRISRELHDAWGHELTALGLQLEIASNTDPGRAGDNVMEAKSLVRALLVKVRDAVAVLREAERSNVTGTLPRGDIAAGRSSGGTAMTAGRLETVHHWIFGCAALAVTLSLGSPILQTFLAGTARVSALWLIAFGGYGAAVLVAILLKPRPALRWTLLTVQLASVAAMAFIVQWAMMAAFLIMVAWQVAMASGPVKALGWVAFQTLVVVGVLALAPRPDLCWVLGMSIALQLFFVFGAQALRKESETARALARTNEELRSAQALIANAARDAERLRISRELHDAWGHELTALGLQLEIASHVADPVRAQTHVRLARGLSTDLLGKVRDVVATLRAAEGLDLKIALEALAQSVPVPAIHVDIAADVRVDPDQAHALIRCAQEAVTNAVRHAGASNLWLEVASDRHGVRLVARNDGSARPAASAPGSGLLGMRERVEALGGNLAVQAGAGLGFTVDAWLPSSVLQPA